MTSPSLTTPIDELHRQCLGAQADIRRQANAARAYVAIWEPRPFPSTPSLSTRVPDLTDTVPLEDVLATLRPKGWFRT